MTKQKEVKPKAALENAIPPSAAAAVAKLNDFSWKHFPQIEGIFKAEGLPQICGRIEKTCRQLDQMIQSGTALEKSRARSAMRAYGRALELLRQIEELRANAAQPAGK